MSENAQFVFVLIASIVSYGNLIISITREANAYRDTIITGTLKNGEKISLEYREIIFHRDWIPLIIGTIILSTVFAVIILSAPILIRVSFSLKRAWLITLICSAAPLYVTYASITYNFADFAYLKVVLKNEKRRLLESGEKFS
jgi:energy-converting hydrogenase Eha subunit C